MMCPVKSRNGNNLGAGEAELPCGERFRSCFFVICREKAADEMKLENILAFCVLIILTGSSQTRGQNSTVVSPEASRSPDPTENPGHEVSQRTHNPPGQEETSTETTITGTGVHSVTVKSEAFPTSTVSSTEATSQQTHISVVMTSNTAAATVSASTRSLSSTPTVQSSTPPQHISTTEARVPLTTDPLTTFSSPPAHTVQDTSSTAHASTVQRQSESLTTTPTQPTTTGFPLTSAPGQSPAGPPHKEVPSELNVGDEDHKPRSNSSLDPLLAGLLSVFIVTTAIIFIVLFLKFRQRTNHPEFHRLQDLPMDDLMEDTPLSRYSY
ncbi:mucin-12-like [Xyrichtys novacula]|uniref:Mucin-12-like n=1 Tax=Xyrichtys novacula TaxID=13765 RepID=A0AAV1GE72_XYRNO|nr:mucin-12-like [Xyrichtys novacula]